MWTGGEKKMKHLAIGSMLMAAIVAGAGLAGASTTAAGAANDTAIEKQVVHEILMYPRYTIWDNVGLKVHEGNVELTGVVSQPYKKEDLTRLAKNVPGVASVTNELKVLPLSPFDDELRIRVARAIYGDPILTRYAIQPRGPIHIIVDNGQVTLEGVVGNQMDKQVAGLRANGAGLSFGLVVNNLKVEKPAPRHG
jgi:hyperosmotically inducible protein